MSGFYFDMTNSLQLEESNDEAEQLTGVDFTTGNTLMIKVYTDEAMMITLYNPNGKMIHRYSGPEAEDALTYLKHEGLLKGYGEQILDYLEQTNYLLA